MYCQDRSRWKRSLQRKQICFGSGFRCNAKKVDSESKFAIEFELCRISPIPGDSGLTNYESKVSHAIQLDDVRKHVEFESNSQSHCLSRLNQNLPDDT